MKKLLFFIASLMVCACGLDNYEAPSSLLTGKVTYNGEPLQLAHGDVRFNMYQDGYEKNGPITVSVASDGTFSALVFDGTYHLRNIDDNAPWTNDVPEVTVEVKGSTSCEVKVTPYFLLENASIALDGNEVKGICSVTQVALGHGAKQIFLAVGKTQFINDQSYSYLARKTVNTVKVNGSHSFTLDIEDLLSTHECLYARIGLEVEGISKYIYTEAFRIK